MTQVIDLCDDGLCMGVAAARVTVSAGDQSVSTKVCGKHRDEIVAKIKAANEEPGAQLGLTIVALPNARVA